LKAVNVRTATEILKPKIANAAVIRRKLHAWFAAHGRDLPWRRNPSPYAVIVSELMLQQTQVATVIPYFERWMARFPDFTALAQASESDVLAHWQGLGYYARARNLHRAAKHVVDHHGGELPNDPGVIAELPGVGPYTAGAIAAFAFDRPVVAIDGNIARVLSRLGNLQTPIDTAAGRAMLQSVATELLPGAGGRVHTSAVMELGALICAPRAPRCEECPVRRECQADEPERLPLKKPRPKVVRLEERCAWIVRQNSILLEQQLRTRWRGLWKLPAISSREEAPGSQELCNLEYPFTHHRVTLRVFDSATPNRAAANQRWFPLNQLETVPITAPHRRAIEQLRSLPTNRALP
jgi:A/G-specific adenine glycosylase